VTDRTKQISFRVTPEEYNEIATSAAIRGLSINAYLRERSLGWDRFPVDKYIGEQLDTVAAALQVARRRLGVK
jgi:hypothetical protein